jgi:manganese/zinc/iron transport system substrate-binding protein
MRKKFTETDIITGIQIALLGAILLLAGCQTEEKKAGEKLYVVTSTGMIEDAVQRVAGTLAEVTALMGPGVDPHLYKATHGDLNKLTRANLVFYNGLHLEGKMGDVLQKLARTRPVVAVADGVPESRLRTVPGFAGAHDPHIWFDVDLWKHAVVTITEQLQRYDTAHADVYAMNSKRYVQQLDSLHEQVKLRIREVPEQQRVLITAHDAFGYFGDAYGIEVRGLQGISTVAEFGLRDITELVNFIISRKIKAIFVETSVSGKSIQAVVEGCREKGWEVKIGGNLFSDAMGAKGTPEGTYIGMINANVNTIVNALK